MAIILMHANGDLLKDFNGWNIAAVIEKPFDWKFLIKQ